MEGVTWIRAALLCLLSVAALPATAAEGLARLEGFLDGLQTLTARFDQNVLDTENNTTGSFSGIFYLQRPDKFRWEYAEPEPQQVIADGKWVYLVDPEIEHVDFRSQDDALRGTPGEVLLGDGKVQDSFEVIELGDRHGLEWLELIPRDAEAQFVRILLAFEGKELRRIEMSDHLGQYSRFVLTGNQRNVALDPKLFDYTPPDGADIFEY